MLVKGATGKASTVFQSAGKRCTMEEYISQYQNTVAITSNKIIMIYHIRLPLDVYHTIMVHGWMIDLTCLMVNRISLNFIVTSN